MEGFPKLSLISCPIALYPATTSAEKTHFHHIKQAHLKPSQKQMVDAETGRVIDRENKDPAVTSFPSAAT